MNRRTGSSKRRPRRSLDSHLLVIRAAAALRGRPVDILGGVLDVAGLAVDAVLRVDDEAGVRFSCLVVVDDIVHAGGAIEARGLTVSRPHESPHFRGTRKGLNLRVSALPDGESAGWGTYARAEGAIIAVGTPITERPPHRSLRARFTHRAPTSDV